MSDRSISGDAGFDPELFTSYARQVGHGGALGISYVGHGPAWVELGLDHQEKLIGIAETGVIASGPIISLMDMACSMALWVKLNRFQHQATLDMRIDYLRPARQGARIVGRGECYAVTNSVGFVRGIAHDGDAADPVAHVAGTFVFTSSWAGPRSRGADPA